jgi:SnoaL-like domain
MHAREEARRAQRMFLTGFVAGAAALAILGAGVVVNAARPVRPPSTTTVTNSTVAPTLATPASASGEALPGIATLAGPVQRRITRLPDGPLYWHIENFPTIAEANQHATDTAMAMEAEGKGWMFTLGNQEARTPGANFLTSIGPLPIPTSTQYMLQLSYQSRSGKLVGNEHFHPGVESWYMVQGEQRVELPTLGTELYAQAGEGMLGPPGGTPIRIINAGSGERRAFNLFVLDATKPASNEGADVATVDAAFKKSFQAGDLDASIDLFAPETVEISPFGVFPGKPAIRRSVEDFMRANAGFTATFSDSRIVDNTAVHRVTVTSKPIQATGIDRFVLIETLVVSRGKIVMLSQQLDLTDPQTASYSLGLAPEGR